MRLCALCCLALPEVFCNGVQLLHELSLRHGEGALVQMCPHHVQSNDGDPGKAPPYNGEIISLAILGID